MTENKNNDADCEPALNIRVCINDTSVSLTASNGLIIYYATLPHEGLVLSLFFHGQSLASKSHPFFFTIYASSLMDF
jgi:hypothetical protein